MARLIPHKKGRDPMGTFDPETLQRWRGMEPRAIYDEARAALYQRGAVTSEDFLDAFEELVEEGLLTWDGIDSFEES